MNGFTFLVDIGLVRALAESGDSPFIHGDWFQLAKSGTFFSPVYGKVTISPQDLATMVRNFREVTPKAPTELPIDYDHKSDNPEQHAAGEAKAAGWIENLQLRSGGTELWCKPKWTRRAAEMIAAGEYRFVSPFFLTNYLDKATGKKVGPTLKAAAITNRPFLEGMQEIPAPAIAASDTAVREFGSDKRVMQAVPTAVKGVSMKEEKDEKEEMCSECKKPMSECECSDGEEEVGLSCPQCGAPVAHKSKHQAEDQKESAAASVLEGVKKALDEGGLGEDREGDPDYKVKKGEKKMSEENKDVIALQEKLQAQEEQIRQLSEKNGETEKALKALQNREKDSQVEQLISRAMSEGKINAKLAGTKEAPGWARTFAMSDAKGFESWLENAPTIVEFGERGTSHEEAADDASTTASKIKELAEVKMSESGGRLTFADATKMVFAENRSLADQYDREMIGERVPASSTISKVRRLQ